MCLRGYSYALDSFNTFTTINYRAFVDKAILGVGQVDRYGNINTSFMGGTPKTGMRLTGAGGAPDFVSYAKETILTLKGGDFVEKLDYFTSPGYLGGGDERDQTWNLSRRVRSFDNNLHRSNLPLPTRKPKRSISSHCSRGMIPTRGRLRSPGTSGWPSRSSRSRSLLRRKSVTSVPSSLPSTVSPALL